MNEKYYILNLWDYGTPAFVSCDKMYVGTEAEIRAAIDAMKKSPKGSEETVAAAERYLAGDKTATHNIAYNEIPVLEPCARIASIRSSIPKLLLFNSFISTPLVLITMLGFPDIINLKKFPLVSKRDNS